MYVVAPLVGAWIEIIDTLIENDPEPQSLPSWERGLKLQSRGLHNEKMPSLPSWERGLKSIQHPSYLYNQSSLPSWERGLKYALLDKTFS